MRKLHLKKEHLGELTQEDLAVVIGGSAGKACVTIEVQGTIKDTQCGPQCTTNLSFPVNQCYITLFC